MFSTLGKVFRGGKSSTSIVDKYTKDLANITSEIHGLELKNDNNEKRFKSLQRKISYYGFSALILRMSYLIMNNNYNTIYNKQITSNVLILVTLFIGIKVFVGRIDGIVKQRRINKINKLRSLHNEKLEDFKKDTNFHLTSSIIKRFSSGDNESDDMMLLLNEEIKDKYDELNELKNELIKLQKNDKLKDAQERDKWFDKIINSLAGDSDFNNRYIPIKCSKCDQFNGCYKLANNPISYKCSGCDSLTEENTSKPDQ